MVRYRFNAAEKMISEDVCPHLESYCESVGEYERKSCLHAVLESILDSEKELRNLIKREEREDRQARERLEASRRQIVEYYGIDTAYPVQARIR